MANRAGLSRRAGTAGGAGASRLQRAPEHRGRSAVNCASARKSHRGTVDCVALGPAPSLACGDANADLPAQCWGPSAPTHNLGMVRLCVRSRVSAHVSPSQICYCFQGLSDSERPLKFPLISSLFPGRRASPGLLVCASGPFPSIYLPLRTAPPPPPHCAGLCRGTVAWLQDFIK